MRILIGVPGHVPSFKNSKMITRGRLITDPKKQQRMDQITQNFVSILRSIFQIEDGETLMGPVQLSWIASSLPEDDSWDWIPEIHVKAVKCEKGKEGATIEITPLDD